MKNGIRHLRYYKSLILTKRRKFGPLPHIFDAPILQRKRPQLTTTEYITLLRAHTHCMHKLNRSSITAPQEYISI